MALESPASVITAVLNHTLAAALSHVVQSGNGTATAPSAAAASASPLPFAGNGNGTNGSEIGTMSINDTFTGQDVPQIPAYIRNTSMVFCIVIMCLGVIGNIMVSGDSSRAKWR